MRSANTKDKIWATFSTELFPKTQPPHLEFKRCGKPNCRCTKGLLHGPYIYRRWREGRHQRRQHVPINRLSEILRVIEWARNNRISIAELKEGLRNVR